MSSPAQQRSLIVDLEVVPGQQQCSHRLTMLGALRPDSGAQLEGSLGPDAGRVWQQLDAMTAGAAFVLGHNVIDHDLPVLREQAPDLLLHALPVVDTLRLSPLAFPQNPYHRLVKDYKLIRDSLNSPLADCRATQVLFQDQQQAFAALAQASRAELLCYQALLAPVADAGLGEVFARLTGQPPLPVSALRELIPQLLRETDPVLRRDLKVCRLRLARLIEEDLPDPAMHWTLAYVLAWLRVSGGNSVLAPWVRHQFPQVGRLVRELRDLPCASEECQYCRTTHDPHHELRRYFGYEFRQESDGRNLQHDIVQAGMRGRHVLAVLATGGGKSVCYQLPALNRFHRNGSLTIVVSPLQSLMKDQVDGLLHRNIQCAAALNGLLTMPERADVLEKVRMGDVGILLVSPEQFRNQSFRHAIKQRQIGGWVFDEAHCLSKWGSDFRPDYLYVARFIKDHTAGQELAPISCFTATAKPDVLADIAGHFGEHLGLRFDHFIGSHERPNLGFSVRPCLTAEKWPAIQQLLTEHIVPGTAGGAIVFVASRKNAEELSRYLAARQWSCRHFHAGMAPHEKADIQNDFLQGGLRVIVATNAFGMGVDKPDVRLVVHADIPGSLESYLQEVGRAGRDRRAAQCVLLYDPQDIEAQFSLSERARLSLRDLQQILHKLRSESLRRQSDALLITAGEILLDTDVEMSFSAEERDAQAKVVAAVSWLERAGFVKREENHTQIFPARLQLDLAAAEKALAGADLPARRLAEFRAILGFLHDADMDERVDTDRLMALTGLGSDEVAGALRQMEALGILISDAQITMYLRHGVVSPSAQRLRQSLQLEEALFALLRQQAPDADQGDWQDLHLPSLAAELRALTGLQGLLPLHVLRLLRSLERDHDAANQQHSGLELRQLNHDYLKLRIIGGYAWPQLQRFGAKRRLIAGRFLGFLTQGLPAGVRGKDLLVETSFGELAGVIAADPVLAPQIAPDQRDRAVRLALLYLHKQEILTLNHGMTVMRQAMTIQVDAGRQGSFPKGEFQRLVAHYREKRLQVHVMREYAELALRSMPAAMALVRQYFQDERGAFIERHFSGREEVLRLATSEQSWKSIVESLDDTQRPIVMDDADTSRLVLAGPGSGKTRVIVHRIAYLLRVRRVPASSIVVLAFNRHAAGEIRLRLHALVGEDAYGVSVTTFHGMAMRLTGQRFARGDGIDEKALKQVLANAADLLEGKSQLDGEDDMRARLLRGYRYILVDEYQDIDDQQYRLVSALAGRHAAEEGRLCILAVGDDDQNIYAWREASNRHIARFQEDYAAPVSFLVESYRSSRHIIDAANRIIAENPVRMKAGHLIRIDQLRERQPAGGRWEALDGLHQGRVLRLVLPASDRDTGNCQAQAAMAELMRLLALEGQGDWQGCAVLARSHRYLWPIQAWCEQQGVPYDLAADKGSALPLGRQRGFMAGLACLGAAAQALSAMQAWRLLDESDVLIEASWREFFQQACELMRAEFGEARLAASVLIEWLHEYARESRTQARRGVYLGTVHSAKGLAFRHVVVLDGGWNHHPDVQDDERRLFYVAMTRAAQTLALCQFEGGRSFAAELDGTTDIQAFEGEALPELALRFQQLAMKDIDLGYPGRQPPHAALHQALRELHTGDSLSLHADLDRYLFRDGQGRVVGRTSQTFRLQVQPEQIQVTTIMVRQAQDSDARYRSGYQADAWELVLPRLCGRVLDQP